MSYLLDSNIVIDLLADNPAAVSRVGFLAGSGIFVSTITAMEVRHGLVREGTDALTRFNEFLSETPALEVNLDIALRCGDLRALLAKQGTSTRKRSLDLLIACTAMHHGLVLVTDNIHDFRDIPGLILYHQ